MVLLKLNISFYLIFEFQNLHSNMVLLKPQTLTRNTTSIKNLHSNMVLLKLTIGYGHIEGVYKFTFQYGTTKTSPAKKQCYFIP